MAGVPSPVHEGYGGWETNNGSQSIGHYLKHCSMMAAATGDPELYRRVDEVVEAIAACQAARPDGAVFASRHNADWFEAAARGDVRPPAVTPWYLMHKNLAGLRDAWLHCGNARARDVLVRLADACITFTANITPAQWQVVMGPEHGGPHEVLADVSAITGDPKYLVLARKFRHARLFEPMLKGDEPALYNIHANTQFPKFIGYERIYELTGETAWHEAACHFWEAVTSHLSWVNGGNSQWESFFPPAEFAAKVTENCGPETCNTYNMLKLTRQLFLNDPRVKYLDYYERGLYNHLLASQDPEHGGFVYYTSMRPGHYRVYSNEHDAFWCCVGTGMEDHARYGELIYAHKNDDLYVNLFIPSELRWAAKGLTLRQETRFPDEDRTTLTFRLDHPARLTLKLRWPGWIAPGRMGVRVNGTPAPEAASAGPGSFVALSRTWQTGDTVAIDLPKVVTAEFLPQSQAQGRPYVAFLAGPVVLAAPLGSSGLKPADFHSGDPLAAKALPLANTPRRPPWRIPSLSSVVAARLALIVPSTASTADAVSSPWPLLLSTMLPSVSVTVPAVRSLPARSNSPPLSISMPLPLAPSAPLPPITSVPVADNRAARERILTGKLNRAGAGHHQGAAAGEADHQVRGNGAAGHADIDGDVGIDARVSRAEERNRAADQGVVADAEFDRQQRGCSRKVRFGLCGVLRRCEVHARGLTP